MSGPLLGASMLMNILVVVFSAVIGRGIVLAFGLDQKAARMIRLAAASTRLKALSRLLAGIVGLAGLGIWTALNLDQRVEGWWSPRPEIASFALAAFVPVINIDPRTNMAHVEILAELENTNDHPLKYLAKLTGTINGQPAVGTSERPYIETDGYAGPHRRVGLGLNFPLIKFDKSASWANFNGKFRYEVTYSYEGSSAMRRTHRTVLFKHGMPMKGKLGDQGIRGVTASYRDQLEE